MECTDWPLLLVGAITVAGVCGSGSCSRTEEPRTGPDENYPPPPRPLVTTFKAFGSTQELYDAVDEYVLAEDSLNTAAAKAYGHPMETWHVSRITNFTHVFSSFRDGQVCTHLCAALRTFNEDLNGWDVSQATDMSGMFLWARAFQGDISDWNVGRVKDMSDMFQEADAFDGNIAHWDVGSVTSMKNMFWGADSFQQDLCSWRSKPQPLNCDVTDMFRFTDGCPGGNTPALPCGDSMCQMCRRP